MDNKARVALLVTILIPFAAWTSWLCWDSGYLGFVQIALRDAWAMQMLVDLAIMVGLFSAWVLRDARERGVLAWPWILAAVFLGSPVALTYLIVRELSTLKKSTSLAPAYR